MSITFANKKNNEEISIKNESMDVTVVKTNLTTIETNVTTMETNDSNSETNSTAMETNAKENTASAMENISNMDHFNGLLKKLDVNLQTATPKLKLNVSDLFTNSLGSSTNKENITANLIKKLEFSPKPVESNQTPSTSKTSLSSIQTTPKSTKTILQTSSSKNILIKKKNYLYGKDGQPTPQKVFY